MTKLIATASVAALLAANPAFAGDIYSKGSTKDGEMKIFQPTEGLTNWTGFYVGGQIGYGWSRQKVTTETFNAATPSNCWARGAWTSTNSPSTDPQNFSTLSNDFDLNFSPDSTGTNGDSDTFTDVDVQLPAYGQTDVDPDSRIHTVNAGASVTNVTAEECRDLREDIGLIDEDGADNFPNIASGYDPAVPAHWASGSFERSDAGLLGGGTVGYDIALQRFLIGVYGSVNWSAIEGKEMDWSAGARAGFVVAPRTLLYGKVGFTQASFQNDVTFNGIEAGGGIEVAVGGSVFLGLEYLHKFYGEETLVNTPTFKAEGDLDEDAIMATLKIKLNGFGQ